MGDAPSTRAIEFFLTRTPAEAVTISLDEIAQQMGGNPEHARDTLRQLERSGAVKTCAQLSEIGVWTPIDLRIDYSAVVDRYIIGPILSDHE